MGLAQETVVNEAEGKVQSRSIEAVAAALAGMAPEEKGELEITIEPDVIVVGAGMSGLTAAMADITSF